MISTALEERPYEETPSRGMGVKMGGAGGLAAQTQNPAERTQKILTMLEEELGQLGGNISRLETRLTPVLENVPEAPKDPRPLNDSLSGKLTERISLCLNQVRRYNSEVLNLHDRLEV